MDTVNNGSSHRAREDRLGLVLRRWAGKVLFWLSVVAIVSPALFVLLWMVSLSLKQEIDNIAYPPVFIPTAPTLNNYAVVFEKSPFALYAFNSIVVSGFSTLVALLAGVPAAYGIVKGKAEGIALVILISRMTPGLSYLIPLFMLFRAVGGTNTLWSQAVTHLVITLPLVTWVMMGFFESLHPELEEAALTDGCSIWQAFIHVAVPLARPGMAVAGILAFIFSWNNFVFGVVLAGRETRTLPVAVFNVLTYEQIAWGPMAAAALLVTLPALILTIFVQRHIVTGLAAGGIKG
jgi:multiple sugar transport system permease protein